MPNINNENLNTLPEQVDIDTDDIRLLYESIGEPNGIASLDQNGKVPVSQLPTNTGVESVNGKTGTVILNAIDVDAYSIAQVDVLLEPINDNLTTINTDQITQNAGIGTNATNITTLQQTTATQGTQISTNTTNITSLNTSVATINTTLTTQGQAITSLSNTQATQGTAITANTTAINSLQLSQITQDQQIDALGDNLTALTDVVNNMIPGTISLSSTGTATVTPTLLTLLIVHNTDNEDAIKLQNSTTLAFGKAGRYQSLSQVEFTNTAPNRTIQVDVLYNGVVKYTRQVAVTNDDYSTTVANILDFTTADLTNGGYCYVTYRIRTTAGSESYTINTTTTLTTVTSEYTPPTNVALVDSVNIFTKAQTMNGGIQMNSQRIVGLPSPLLGTEPVDLTTYIGKTTQYELTTETSLDNMIGSNSNTQPPLFYKPTGVLTIIYNKKTYYVECVFIVGYNTLNRLNQEIIATSVGGGVYKASRYKDLANNTWSLFDVNLSTSMTTQSIDPESDSNDKEIPSSQAVIDYVASATPSGGSLTIQSIKSLPIVWSSVVWTYPDTKILGAYIWHTANNTYFSQNAVQYKLNKTTNIWEVQTWTGLTNFTGEEVWTDGTNIYYSKSSQQYILNESTNTWTTKTWSGLSSFEGLYIWTDGNYIYNSSGSSQYILNIATSTWSVKSWSGNSTFAGSNVWSDGYKIYCYDGNNNNIVLDTATSTWSTITFSGYNGNILGTYVWRDNNNNIYYSNSTTQYILQPGTTNWKPIVWNIPSTFTGNTIWTDSKNIYLNNSTDSKVLTQPLTVK